MSPKKAAARHHRGSAAVAECGADIDDRGNVAPKKLLRVITEGVPQSQSAVRICTTEVTTPQRATAAIYNERQRRQRRCCKM
ncbi:MAG: hypothetical protein II986_01285 [Alistipes sp.]|nr:hypothetical protein [Alistipes sp.]